MSDTTAVMSGNTPTRPIRIPDDLWGATKEKAAAEGDNASAVIRRLLTDYTQDRLPGYQAGYEAARKELLALLGGTD